MTRIAHGTFGSHLPFGPSRGADVVQEPIEQDYGVRDCAVRDPAGNMIRIQETR